MHPRLLLSALALAGLAVLPSYSAENSATAAAPSFTIPEDAELPGTGPMRRYDWFRNLWRERRTGFAARAAEEQGAVVFLGDSITQGWRDGLARHFPEIRTANRGIGGDTTRGVLYRLDEDVLSLEPRAVVLLVGTNDLEEHAEPWVPAANIRLIIERLRAARPTMPVVLCEVFPSSPAKRRPHGKIQRLNRLLREVVRDQPQVTLLDTWGLFANAENDAKPEEFPDLLHPNEQGYAKWATALRPVFATLGFLEQEPDDFAIEPGFEPLFNGRDLNGWGLRPTSSEDRAAAAQWQADDPYAAVWPIVEEPVDLQGQTESPDGRFVAQHGRLVVRTPAEHRRIQQLWTVREFAGDFVLRLEFRASPGADSGVYIRGPQLQCRDYGIAGPYQQLERYRPQDWNELEITVRGGSARATCNGELLEDAMVVPASGPIGLEGDRGQVEYRRIRIRPL